MTKLALVAACYSSPDLLVVTHVPALLDAVEVDKGVNMRRGHCISKLAASMMMQPFVVPVAPWGQPSGVGQVIDPIVSGRMAFATRAALAVDGGLSLARL